MNYNYKKILKESIDLHMHIGPEIIPRKFTLPELIKSERRKLKGIGVKNHFQTTTSFARPESDDLIIIDSVTLNSSVGGFSPEAITKVAQVSKKPIIVWFPTVSARNILKNQKFEIPPEWSGCEIKNNKLSSEIEQLEVSNSKGQIKTEVKKVLEAIKKNDAILATGHISWQETVELVSVAQKGYNIGMIIITHPIYQRINMPIEVQKRLASSGAFIEQAFSMFSIDKIQISEIVKQIKVIGPKNCILTSDVGQSFSLPPSDALLKFMKLLNKEGISEKELKIMMIDNPAKLINNR